MAKVTVYHTVSTPLGRMEIQRAMAIHGSTQAALDVAAEKIRVVAEGVLKAHRHQGHSEILPVESGSVDRFVVLSDERGLKAAYAIEKGAKGGRGGVHALAAGIAAAIGGL